MHTFNLFFVWPSKILTVLSAVSLIFEIVIRKLIAKKSVPFSASSTLGTWVLTFLVIIASPLFLSKHEFLAPIQSIWFYFPLLSIVMHTIVGMWITHDVVLSTETEKKNIGRYIADHKLLDIIDSTFVMAHEHVGMKDIISVYRTFPSKAGIVYYYIFCCLYFLQ